MIPKKIHQIFWDFKGLGRSISEEDSKNAQTYKKLHPDWGYQLWNLEDADRLVENKFKWFKNTWYKLSNIMKCDSLRYMIMYEEGGVYVDLDSICLKPLDDLLHHNIVLPRASQKVITEDSMINNFMMSKPNQIFWIKLLRHVDNFKGINFLPKLMTVFLVTGPVALTMFYKLHQDEITAFDSHYFDCKPGSETEDTYVIHYGNVTWIDKNDKNSTWIYILVLIIIILIVIILILLNLNRVPYY